MAGIGFELRKLQSRDGLAKPVAAIGHAAVIAAGPWLFTISALAAISILTVDRVGLSVLGDFRIVVIYAFCLSIVATGATNIIATRLAADAVYDGRFQDVRPLFLTSLVLGAGLSVLVAGGVLGLLLPAAPVFALAGVLLTAIVGSIWIAMTFCSAIRNYAAVTRGFAVGLASSVAGAVAAAEHGLGSAGMLAGMGAGLVVVLFVLVRSILIEFPFVRGSLPESLEQLVAAHRRLPLLAVSGLVAAVALWADKWVLWASAYQKVDAGGLFHAPLYDSAMFVAYLAIIPSLAFFVSVVETEFHDRIMDYYRAIGTHGTLAEIDAKAETLARETRTLVLRIVLIQAVICAVAIIASPSLVEVTRLHFEQMGILRNGILGALFHFVFLMSTTLLLYFERHGPYLLLQVLFAVLLTVTTALTVWLGESYLGLGYLVSSAVAAVAAWSVLDRTLANAGYITFIMSASRQAAVAAAPRRWRGWRLRPAID